MTVGDGIIGQTRRRELQVERAGGRDLDGARHRAGPAREAAVLFARAAEVGERAGREPAVELVERTTGAHRRERGCELTPRRRGVVDVVGRDDLDARVQRDFRERVIAVPVDRVAVVPQLDEHAVTTERGDQPVERAPRRTRTVARERRRDRPLPASREYKPRVVSGRARKLALDVRQHGERQCTQLRLLLAPSQMDELGIGADSKNLRVAIRELMARPGRTQGR